MMLLYYILNVYSYTKFKIREDNEEHKKEKTIKLLECSIRALKMEMEKMKSISFATYKKRNFLSYLYAHDKLTMLIISVIDKNYWGFVYVRDTLIPRTWDTRLRWLKLFDLMLCTRVYFINNNTNKNKYILPYST